MGIKSESKLKEALDFPKLMTDGDSIVAFERYGFGMVLSGLATTASTGRTYEFSTKEMINFFDFNGSITLSNEA